MQHGLAAVAKAWGFDRDRTEGAADLVDYQRRKGFALNVFGKDDQRLAALHDLLEDRQDVLDGRDLGVSDEDVGILKLSLHALWVGDEVRGDVTLVEAHALGELKLQAEGIALFNCDYAFLADLVHCFGDQIADFLVATCGDCGRRSDLLLGLNILGHRKQLITDDRDGAIDALLKCHWVCTSGHVAQTFAHERLGQHRCGGGAVACDVIGLLGYLFDQLSADLLVRILKIDFLGDGNTVVGDRGGSPLLLKDYVAAFGAECDLDGVG